MDKLSKDELKEIAKRYYEITKDENKKEMTTEVSQIEISANKVSQLFSVSRQTITSRRSGIIPSPTRISSTTKHYQIINEAFIDNYGRYGRERLSQYLKIHHNVYIAPRTLGYIMGKLGLKTTTRVAKKVCESKNTKANIKDYVKRDCNPVLNNIFATDVKYFCCNLEKRFDYLLIVISHKTKLIESYEFSKNNDANLVERTYNNIDKKNITMHSDHGSQYSSDKIRALAKSKGFRLSMSRVGNSLDNREAEYFFSILESELLQGLPLKTMSFEEVKYHVGKFINWYNTKRIQSILGWKAPAQANAKVVNY